MKKSYIKLLIFNAILLIILFLNSFISSILSYNKIIILLITSLIICKKVFGFEKDRHRYTKEVIIDILIIILLYFIIYYLFGLLIGFVKTNNYYTLNGFKNIIIPTILIICLKEYLKYQLLTKCGNSKKLIIITCITFIFIDITNLMNIDQLNNGYQVFIFISTILLPAISKNAVSCYICQKVGYKPNLLWILIIELYVLLLPIIPNVGMYIKSIIDLLFPLLIGYKIYKFFNKNENTIPLGKYKNTNVTSVTLFSIFIITLTYFTSGFFKYYTIAVGSGSMNPNIQKGDVVVINQKFEEKDLKENEIIAYQYENKIIIHRLVKIEKIDNEYYYYTKGDANNAIDNYIVYGDMIKGIVKVKIPFVGMPTIWLNEL